jgi:hypothetical protein
MLNLHRLISNSSSTMNFPWLSLTINWTHATLGTLLNSHGQTRIAGNMSRDHYCRLTSQRITESTCHVIPTHYCVTSPAHALHSNSPCADMKETLPQCCCVVHALERAHWAAAQQCLEQIRHNSILSELGWGKEEKVGISVCLDEAPNPTLSPLPLYLFKHNAVYT